MNFKPILLMFKTRAIAMNPVMPTSLFGSRRTLPGAVRCCGLILILVLAVSGAIVCGAADIGKTFASPEEVVSALTAAVNAQDTNALRLIFGPAVTDIQNPDHVQASNDLAVFTAALNQRQRIERQSATRAVLEVGEDAWPFPVPIVKKGSQWFFDTEAGKEELLNRRIGRNELMTLQVVRAYVEAQREYATKDRDGDDVLEFAQKLISTPGTKDGLYWPADLDGEVSPFGPLAAQAQFSGYHIKPKAEDAAPEPFHGYYFKVLTRQGKSAPGGQYDYIINGNMIGGFALVAWPAEYGNSAMMTFIVNQQGRVYQKDLGPKTAKIAAAMKAYDPDNTWVISRD